MALCHTSRWVATFAQGYVRLCVRNGGKISTFQHTPKWCVIFWAHECASSSDLQSNVKLIVKGRIPNPPTPMPGNKSNNAKHEENFTGVEYNYCLPPLRGGGGVYQNTSHPAHLGRFS